MGKIRVLIFLLAAAGGGYALHTMARTSWGRESQYRIAHRGADEVGGKPTREIRLYTISGEPRQEFEVPTAIYDKARTSDDLHVEMHRLPVGGELHKYRLSRGGELIVEWTEGGPIYFTFLGGLALVIGVVVMFVVGALLSWMGLGAAAKDA